MARKRLALAQNFFRCPDLVRTLVAASAIDQTDTVIEIGPGAGIITQALATVARRVVAIEKDPVLVRQLQRRFHDSAHIEIIEGDFLATALDIPVYKLFANIPFNLTAQIVRKILAAPYPPCAAYLVVQQEAGQKFAGWPTETQFAVLAKPWFELDIVHTFQRTDFMPAPSVDVVFLQIKKRDPPLVDSQDTVLYRAFVRYGFAGWKQNLRLTYAPLFTYRQWKRISTTLRFSVEALPTQLTFAQWLGLFHAFLQHVPETKRNLIFHRE